MYALAAGARLSTLDNDESRRCRAEHVQFQAHKRNAAAKAALPKWRAKRVIEHISINISKRISLADMAGAAGLSRMHFAAQFRIATGMRPHDFLLRRRIETAQDLLLLTDHRIIDVAVAVGFQTQAHFSTVFKRVTGDTPHHWRVTTALHSNTAKSRCRPSPAILESTSISLMTLNWKASSSTSQCHFSVVGS